MAGSRPPGEKRCDEDTLNASRRSDVSKYDPFWEPPPDERQAAWNKIAEAVEAYSVSTDASTLASLLREEAIVHFYMAEALERITDDPHQKSKAIEIKRSEDAQVESFPPRAVISEANYKQIRELVETGRRESLWEAFHTNPSLASDLIVEDAKTDLALRQAADSNLTFLLQAQARVQLSMALALAQIADDPHRTSRAIEILLDEAAQLTDRETLCSALRWLESFEPLAVIPKLIAFLRKAYDVPVRDAALDTLEHLILHGLAPNASGAPAALSSECVIPSVDSPRVPIHPDLTIVPSPGQTAPVPRTDTTQQTPPGPTAAPSPDFDLATASLTPTVSADRRTRTGLAPEQESCENVNSSRQHLKAAAGYLAQLDPGLFEHGEFLKVTAELNVAFSNIVDRLLRPEIEPIEHSINEQLMSRGSATLAEKQDLSKWANAELRAVGLAIRCPKTGRPSTLLAGPGNQPIVGRFQLQHKGVDGKWKRPLSTPTLPYLRLMPDLPSLDVDLASVLGRLAGDRVDL